MATFRTLSSLSVRLCDPIYTDPAQGQEAISVIMPFLLTEGLQSPVKEVLGLTIEQIQKICKGKLVARAADPIVLNAHVYSCWIATEATYPRDYTRAD